jgi:hypothetical protein
MAIQAHMWPFEPFGPKYDHTGPYVPTCGHSTEMGHLGHFVPPTRSSSPPRKKVVCKFPRARACACVFVTLSLQKFRCVSSTAPLRESTAASPGDERLKHRADGIQRHTEPVEAAPRLPALPSHPSYLRSRGSSSRSEPFQGSSRALRGPFATSCRRFRPPFRQLFPQPGSPLRKVFQEPQVTVLKRFFGTFSALYGTFRPTFRQKCGQ